MIQDISPHIFTNHYEPLQPNADSRAVFLRGGKLLTAYNPSNGSIIFPLIQDISAEENPVYLFSIDTTRFYLILSEENTPEGYGWNTLRDLRGMAPKDNLSMFIVYTAWHLADWYAHSRYCGQCGSKTEYDSSERAMSCPKCGHKIYPRINPAVIVGVRNGEKLLLTRYKTGFAFNALIAGFTEIGETMEETVQREVMEEVGLRVKNIRYYKSQPWGIAADILMGFYCDVDGNDTITRDDSELKYAEWVERKDIVLQPDNLSLTNEMMWMFKEGRDHECG